MSLVIAISSCRSEQLQRLIMLSGHKPSWLHMSRSGRPKAPRRSQSGLLASIAENLSRYDRPDPCPFQQPPGARIVRGLALELGSDHVVQDNRNTAARRGGTCRLRNCTNHASSTGDHPNSGRRDQIADRDGRAAPFQSSECQPYAIEKSGALAANGILYQISGSTEIS